MLYINGIGHFHPENVIDNKFFEELDIDTSNQWIMDRVGIRERRTSLDLDYIKSTHNKNPRLAKHHSQFTDAQTAAKAAAMALERANLKPADIGMVIAGGCALQYSLPANASIIAAELGIEAIALDINSACSSFATHIHLLNHMEASALPDYILLVIPENWTASIDFSDRKSAVLIGDCSVATIVSKKIKSKLRVSYTTLASNPAGWNKVMTPAGEHFVQEGPAVQKFAIKKTMATLKELQDKMSLDFNQSYFIGHQANAFMLKAVCKNLNIPAAKHLFNVDQYGNCGAAGAPSVLSQHYADFVAGDRIALVVVGAGLTWGGMVIEVGENIEN